MIRKRIRGYSIGYAGSVRGWNNIFNDVPAFIIGNGPSLKYIDLSLLHNRFSIGINRIFRPYVDFEPTILMWQDIELWFSEKHRIPSTRSIKYCKNDSDVGRQFYHFKLSQSKFDLPNSASCLYGRGATGPLAFQLAYILGCNPIVLIGMDCKYTENLTNFYGKNPHHKPHTLKCCRKGLEWIANNDSGIKIYNCSNNDIFADQNSLEEVLNIIKEKDTPENMESYIKRLQSASKRY